MATPAVSLLALERAWFDASPKRAAGGRHALAGFSYQLVLSLKAFFCRVLDNNSTATSTATLAFDGLSDLAELQGGMLYLTQIKRTLNREAQKSAVAEFLEFDHFLERQYPSLRDQVSFRVIGGRRGRGLDESWESGRLGLVDDEARRWQRIREDERFHGYAIEGDPRLELAIQLWKTVPRSYDFVNACIAKLQHLLGANRGSQEIAEALFQDLQHSMAHETIVGTLLGPRDFEPAATPTKRILIGQRPRLADVREACFMERAERVRPILEVIQQAIPFDSPVRDGGRKVPVVWISGGSGVGKSVLLLQSLREVVCELDLPVIYLEHFAEDLPEVIEQIGSGRALIAADDLYAPDERRPELWGEINHRAHGAPNITLFACGPDESREAFVEMANRHGVLSVQKVDVPLLTGSEQTEYFQWFCDRTGSTDLRRPTHANFVVAAFALDRARQGDASVEEFAARLKQRLQALSVYDTMLATLAVNRLGIRPPVSFFGGLQDALRQLQDERLVWLNVDPDGKLSVSFHAAIGRLLYDIYRPERASAEARALDIAVYFRAIAGDRERALSLINLLRGDKKAGKRIPERLAGDALEKICEVLFEYDPPHLQIGLLLACKRAIGSKRPGAIRTIIRPDRILTWMASPDVDAKGWALLLQIVWDVLPPDRRTDMYRQTADWLERHRDLAPWNFLWQLLWKENKKYEGAHAELIDLAHRWLEQHVQDPAWNRVFQPLIDSGEQAAWLRESARQALAQGPATDADIGVWDKTKGLGLTDSEAAKLLLIRLCKSRSPKIHLDGTKRLANLRGVVDPPLLATIFSEHPDEPGWSFTFVNLSRFMVAPRETIRRELLPVGLKWLTGREDRPEWSHVWQALLKGSPNDAMLRELVKLGAAWCRNREERIEYPYVEREIKTRAARYWGELPELERVALLQELIVQWTHDSTAIEGNSLSLGETKAVIELGLTISGKPLKDHHEVIGHKRAVDLIYGWSERTALTFDDLFDLHRAIFTEATFDIMQPIGAWKVEKNRVDAKTREGRIVDIEFADPARLPTLMAYWLDRLNHWLGDPPHDTALALGAFVELHVGFVRVHPFFDGNGRMARLLANLPLLKAGFPPLIVPEQKREDYKVLHTEYDLAVGRVESPSGLLPQHEQLREIRWFCRDAWQATLDRVATRVFAYWIR